jgi:hypothetical protein
VPHPHDIYSPERRTAVVLSGTGADGAYHAGVLRALHEAGVKIDLVGGRGIGALGAVFSALDGGGRLWEANGFWRDRPVRGLYAWRWPYRAIGAGLVAAAAVLLSPLLLLAVALLVYPSGTLLGMAGLDAGSRLTAGYAGLVGWLFEPPQLPTWLPRLVAVILGALVGGLGVAAIAAVVRAPVRRRSEGGLPWRLLGAPLDSGAAADAATRTLWDLLRGGAALKRPSPVDLSHRFIELLAENLGQPGCRELLLVAHDLDARRDVVFGLLAGDARRRLFPPPSATGPRRAEAFDLGGLAREHLADALAAALAVPAACEPRLLRFAPDTFWRGEAHRLCDRPAALSRVLEEAAAAGIEQVIVVTGAPDAPGPHVLRRPRLDLRGRLGEQLASEEAAAVRDAVRFAQAHFHAVYVVRPSYNPIGPFDLAGTYDEASDRRHALDELLERGYEDAHRLFVEPALGAAGERLPQGAAEGGLRLGLDRDELLG